MIEWFINDGSVIRRIGYDAEIKSMYIDFMDSETDVPYCNVPEEVFREFVSTTSFIRFFLENIKGCYDCQNFRE